MRLTLLTGSSTSLREQLTRCLVLRRPGLVAVGYAVEPGPDGLLTRTVVDAGGTLDAERLAPEGCCLACAVREDVPAALDLVDGRWDDVLLVLPTPVRAGALAAELDAAGRPVDTVASAVDARLLRSQLSGDDLLADRGQAAAPADRRSTAELVLGHLDDADVVAVAELTGLSTDDARTVEALLAHLAPLAVQVTVGPGGTGCDDVVGTGRRGRATDAEREQLATLAGTLCPPACGVATAVWRADRPLHSGRLADALPGLVATAVRTRGHVWLADRPRHRLRLEQAGGSVSLGDAERWDRLPSSSLVVTGVGLDPAVLQGTLDGCLATDAELAALDWPDPFERALGPATESAG
ncbi:MAG: GTP-binding protein [Actinomycetes bacterium]